MIPLNILFYSFIPKCKLYLCLFFFLLQDTSDAQWRNFRGNLQILTVVFGIFTLIANLLRTYCCLRAKGMANVWLLISLAYLSYLHGAWYIPYLWQYWCVGYMLWPYWFSLSDILNFFWHVASYLFSQLLQPTFCLSRYVVKFWILSYLYEGACMHSFLYLSLLCIFIIQHLLFPRKCIVFTGGFELQRLVFEPLLVVAGICNNTFWLLIFVEFVNFVLDKVTQMFKVIILFNVHHSKQHRKSILHMVTAGLNTYFVFFFTFSLCLLLFCFMLWASLGELFPLA